MLSCSRNINSTSHCSFKLAMLKICSTSVTFLSLGNLEAALEEVMQLKSDQWIK
jgi:hypothetical protein